MLPGVFASLAPLLNSYGYLAVGGLLLAENAGVPLPGETILIAAAVYAGAGQLNIVLVALIALVACIVGDNAGYALGRFGGRRVVLRYGRYVLLTEARLEAAERFFDRHGSKIVTVARFIAGLRQANGVLAGMTGMPWLRFVLFNALGAALWVGTWCTVGYLAGSNIQTVYDTIGRYSLLAGGLFLALLLALILRHRCRHRSAPV
jgi:membrane protein DedA with SNARE-associated domain